MALKLIVESVDPHEMEYLVEEQNTAAPSAMYIRGPYILVGEKNKNGRVYDPFEMELEVERYKKEMVIAGRALGELNHPPSAEVNLERACHKIVELVHEGKHYIGKSKLLSSPLGKLVRTLIVEDKVKIGVSTRCLGKLINEGAYNKVQNARIVAVDCVADPSAPSAFVNGILEAKSYIIGNDGLIHEAYEAFEDALSTLPRHDVDEYLKKQIVEFIQKISR